MADLDACVVDVGDMSSGWTSVHDGSSLHRVMYTNSMDRYSVVIFFSGDLDCSLKGMDMNQKNDVEGLTLEEYDSTDKAFLFESY